MVAKNEKFHKLVSDITIFSSNQREPNKFPGTNRDVVDGIGIPSG